MIRINNVKNILISIIIVLLTIINITPLTGSLSFEKQIKIYNYRNIIIDNDTTPPVTTIEMYGMLGENGWFVDFFGVDIKLVATDDMSGIDKTYYKIDGGERQIYIDMFKIQEEGTHVIEYNSVDNAGNVEDIKTAELKLDNMQPIVDLNTKRLGIKKWRFTVSCFDETSGMDRVEFYCDDKLEFIDYEKPYEWIWNGSKIENHEFLFKAYDKAGNECNPYSIVPARIFGIISNPNVSEDIISFFAIKVLKIDEGDKEIISLKNFTIYKVGFSGFIGKFFIFASYIYGGLVD